MEPPLTGAQYISPPPTHHYGFCSFFYPAPKHSPDQRRPLSHQILPFQSLRFNPPKAPRVAMERMNTSCKALTSFIRKRSPNRAPPENGLEGSTAMIPILKPLLNSSRANRSVRVLSPEPGAPVIPITRALPVMECTIRIDCFNDLFICSSLMPS